MKWNALKSALLLVIICFVSQSYAWDRIGHQLIAQIALNNMHPQAKYRAIALMDVLRPQYGYTSFVKVATWADDIRRHNVEAFTPWHYINKAFSPDETPLPVLQKQNVVWAIVQAENVLQSVNANRLEKGLFFRFLVHFVGDVHQPLHAATRVTANLPQGDAGGNLYPIRYHKIKNLHKLWDRGVGLFTAQYRYPLKSWQINKLAQQIERRYPISRVRAQAKDLNPNHWAKESFFYAKKHVYTTAPHKKPSAEYIKKSRDLVMQRIALAGYRLAAVLNFIFNGGS